MNDRIRRNHITPIPPYVILNVHQNGNCCQSPQAYEEHEPVEKFYHLIFLDVAVSVYMSSLEKELVPNLLINCCKPSKIESEQQQEQPAVSKGCHSDGDRGAKNGILAIFARGRNRHGKGQFAKLANQVTIALTMVGLVEGMVYTHKAGLDVGLYLEAISTGVAGSKSLDLYEKRILKRDFEAGFFVNHFVKDLGICQNMGIALLGLALAQQLYLSLKAHGEGYLDTQALILVLERLNNVSLPPSDAF
ncbi:3-hydroxyisobutyrate dehydrogenase-like 1 [Vigna angularis]|uniref:3-hydroxyisobutyrate dehydrogenase-like 1 n=1 Tax=Phaseolus angularis TaxID=3914 RepID=A0A8T0K6F6_PHAAN|nr:3-hydroxyisobutyrate dehydrogenase-like 1 [Vigna angularis]